MDTTTKANETLKKVYGHHAFRPGQQELVEGLLNGRDVLGVMPTGSGKSLCYQIPALLLSGTTLVISPLISLMKDQVTALKPRGITAAFLNSSMDEAEYRETVYQAASGAYKILYAAPERLQAPGFQELCQHMEISLVAVDEAHCISQWGQDFRPSYLKIPEFISSLPKRPVIGAFTATATPNVRKDILENLKLKDPEIITTGFDRPNLSFSVYQPKDRDKTLSELLRDRYRQSGIIYCATRKNVEAVCTQLDREGFSVTRYHAGLDAEERRRNQEDFLFDRKRIMVATNAFGMGIDKSNVSYVIHYNMPKSIEAYYQEAGRAGRDGCDADCILLYAPQDVITARWLIEHSEPNPDLTPEEQAEVRAKDEERMKWMTFYAKSRKCLRHELLRYFGEKAPDSCDNCSNCVPSCEHTDITTEAQMILSCIARTDQQYSEEVIAQLMNGVLPYPPPEGINPGELTTFGLMNDTEESSIREMIRALLAQGYLEQNDDNCLKLNNQSREVLFSKRRVVMKRGTKTRESTDGENLFHALQRLRYEISSREYVAASALFSDSTLRDICRILPRTKKQLASVDGMGLFKANKYGNQILMAIRLYMPKPEAQKAKKPEKQIADPVHDAKTDGFQACKDRMIARGSTEAYQPWTKTEDEQLIREQKEGKTTKEMSEIHKRTQGAIRSRLKKLELT
ncbi:MAG: DNA helicase RecQ [Clostridia bacterium]|nr:DNA helicase RecQ [Clostridia bacterium]